METDALAAVWPEHTESLEGVAFGQSVIDFYKDSYVVSAAGGADLDEISRRFAKHPLNVSGRTLSREESERLWSLMIPPNAETATLLDLKDEVLRQVRLYIEKGLEVLHQRNPQQDSKPDLKRKRSDSDAELDAKRQKPADEESVAPLPAAADGAETDAAAAATPESAEAQSAVDTEGTEPAAEQRETAPGADAEPPKIESTPAEPQDGATEQDAKRAGDKSSDKSGGSDRLDVPAADKAFGPGHRRRRSRASLRRSARNTPEPATSPSPDAAAAADVPVTDEKQNEAPRTDDDAGEQAQASSQAGSDPRGDIPDSDAQELLPEAAAAAAAKPESSIDVPADADDAGRAKRRRSEEPDEPAAARRRGELESMLGSLMKTKAFTAFKQDPPQSSVVVSPTSLSAILADVRAGNLQTPSDVELELMKMLANAVIGEGKNVEDMLKIVDEKIAQLKKQLAQAPSSAKRRRRE